MEIIALTASEEKLFENVDGRTPDACIYNKLTQLSLKLKNKLEVVDSTAKEREWPHNCHNCFMTKSSHKNLVTIGPLVAQIFKFGNVYRQTHRQLDWYTISSPCEPSA